MTGRGLLISGAVFAAGLFAMCAGAALFLSGASRMIVTNASGQRIDHLTVEVCGRRLGFDGLPDGASRTRWYRIRGDSGFRVTGELADGTALDFEGGYVTGGMFLERADITVLPGGEVRLVEH